MLNLCLLQYHTFSLCLDSDSYSEYGSGSGSTKVLNTDPIMIRFHNNAERRFCSILVVRTHTGILFLSVQCGDPKSFSLIPHPPLILIWIRIEI